MVKVTDTAFAYDSDVVYQLDDQEYLEVTFGRIVKAPFTLPYSSSGITPVVYSLTGSYPSWISIDSATGVVTADTSQATIGTTYTFQIGTAVSVGTTWTQIKTVRMKVVQCINPGQITIKCTDCNDLYASRWGKCIYGYVVSTIDGTCVEKDPSLLAKIALTSNQVAGGIGITLAGVISLMNLTTPFAMWMIANQIQLLMLLLLTGAYFPPLIVKILTGSNYMCFSLSVIPLATINIFKSIYSLIGFDQSNEQLYEMGLDSGSALATNLMFFISIISIIVIHLLVLLTPKWKKKDFESKQRERLRKMRKWIVDFFEFAIYIRLTIEAYQFMLLSSVYSIKMFESATTKQLVSLIFAFFVFVLWVAFLIFCLFVLLNSESITRSWVGKFKEIYAGLRLTKGWRFYILLAIPIRRLVYIPFLLYWAEEVQVLIVIAFMVVFEWWICLYLLIKRPFEERKDLIIECVNQGVFFTLVVFLLFVNQQQHWNELLELAFVQLITANNIIVWMVLFGKTCFYI
jgi:hypothetical protein